MPPALTEPQARAVDAILAKLDARTPGGFLLDGVTASGKTEVYLRAVARVLERGGGAIVLVPEIALTPQLVQRFRARLGDTIAVLHSGLTDGERHAMWTALRSGALRVAVGARSALFAPVQDLALVCVDEEHDSSFKQEEGVRYHARDMSLLRAHRAGAVAVLGSATPSVASEQLVRAGKLERLRLPDRARRAAVLPKVEIVDLRRVGAGPAGDKLLSLPLHRALERTLAAREQTILFLNRRGFSPSVVCEECGHLLECPNCAVALTVHRSRGERVICHYCDYHSLLPTKCPECHTERLAQEGAGTERIESLLKAAFPEARIARLDRDVAAGLKSEGVLDRMRRREIDILVGTQMVTKGHDLPSVTLVGVLNADAALSIPDFQASERTFQLLVQVAGRAGRGDVPGHVIVQTRNPAHPAIAMAVSHDVAGFVEKELADRRELGYPPFSRIALVRIDATDERVARAEADRLAALGRRAAPARRGYSRSGAGAPRSPSQPVSLPFSRAGESTARASNDPACDRARGTRPAHSRRHRHRPGEHALSEGARTLSLPPYGRFRVETPYGRFEEAISRQSCRRMSDARRRTHRLFCICCHGVLSCRPVPERPSKSGAWAPKPALLSCRAGASDRRSASTPCTGSGTCST